MFTLAGQFVAQHAALACETFARLDKRNIQQQSLFSMLLLDMMNYPQQFRCYNVLLAPAVHGSDGCSEQCLDFNLHRCKAARLCMYMT
jgi:hypothetical protein